MKQLMKVEYEDLGNLLRTNADMLHDADPAGTDCMFLVHARNDGTAEMVIAGKIERHGLVNLLDKLRDALAREHESEDTGVIYLQTQ